MTLPADLLDLLEHEKPLEDATATPDDIRWALDRIRDGHRYRAIGYRSFDDYLTHRWSTT